jgi:hypothetical protein
VANLYAAEAEQARRDLATLRISHGQLHDTTNVAEMMARLEPTLLHDRLHALPDRVRAMVTAGVHQGATYGLAAMDLQSLDLWVGRISMGSLGKLGRRDVSSTPCTSTPTPTPSFRRSTSTPSLRTGALPL